MISYVFNGLAMSKKDDVTSSMKRHGITNDHKSLRSILAMAKDTMNPFDGELGLTHLFNIGTGEAASDNTEILFFTIKKIHIRMH